MTPSVDLPPLPFLPSAEERIKMVRWGTEIALAERARIAAQVGEMVSKWDGPYYRAGELIVTAIRKEEDQRG